MGEVSPPFSEPPSFFLLSYPSNIEIIFDFSDIITKIHPTPPLPPFQNPGSAPAMYCKSLCIQQMDLLLLGNTCIYVAPTATSWFNIKVNKVR